jgi:hypothetical protein
LLPLSFYPSLPHSLNPSLHHCHSIASHSPRAASTGHGRPCCVGPPAAASSPASPVPARTLAVAWQPPFQQQLFPHYRHSAARVLQSPPPAVSDRDAPGATGLASARRRRGQLPHSLTPSTPHSITATALPPTRHAPLLVTVGPAASGRLPPLPAPPAPSPPGPSRCLAATISAAAVPSL